MKLVRDRIPELAGQPGAFRQADPAEFDRLLRDKLLEEAAEAVDAPGPAELLEELGDVLQVLYALASQAGYSPAEIECARARKARTTGAFTRRVVWHDPPPERTAPMSDGIFISDLEDGCQAAAGWVDYFDHLTLPLTGQALADARATLAAWDDPNSPQGGLGDCWGCVANVNRLRALVNQATQPASRADGPR